MIIAPTAPVAQIRMTSDIPGVPDRNEVNTDCDTDTADDDPND